MDGLTKHKSLCCSFSLSTFFPQCGQTTKRLLPHNCTVAPHLAIAIEGCRENRKVEPCSVMKFQRELLNVQVIMGVLLFQFALLILIVASLAEYTFVFFIPTSLKFGRIVV